MKLRRELSSSPLCSSRRCFCRASWRGVAGCCVFCACPCACAAPPTSAPPLPRARRARAPEARRGQLGRPPLTNAPRPWGGGVLPPPGRAAPALRSLEAGAQPSLGDPAAPVAHTRHRAAGSRRAAPRRISLNHRRPRPRACTRTRTRSERLCAAPKARAGAGARGAWPTQSRGVVVPVLAPPRHGLCRGCSLHLSAPCKPS